MVPPGPCVTPCHLPDLLSDRWPFQGSYKVVFMTRSDLVEELAARFPQLAQRDAEFAVKALLDAMSDAMVKGHRIELRGFGSFSVNRRPPRMGRNPRSGEAVAIPEKRVPHFKPGKALREAVDLRTQELLKGQTP